MQQYDNYEKGLVLAHQPLFIRVVCILGAAVSCLHLVATVIGVVTAISSDAYFHNAIAEAFGGSPVYWFIVHSCIVIASLLIGFFAILCAVSLLTWIYRSLTGLIPFPRADTDVTVRRFSPAYWATIVYSCVYFSSVLYGIVSFGHRFVSELTKDGNGFGIGMLVLTGPFVLIACVAIVMVVFWFCLMLPLGVKLSKMMIRYVTRPSVRREELV